MSSKRPKTARHTSFADTSSGESINLPGLTPEENAQAQPQIFTSKEPSKHEKLPEYMDDSQLEQDTIKKIIHEIQRTPPNKEKRVEYFSTKYADFADKYPILFDMACRDEFDYDKFNYMMRIRGQIAAKQRTIEHASVEVGQKFYNMYMKKDDKKD